VSTPNDTIDITDLVSNLQTTFVSLAKAFLLGEALAIPGLGPFLTWIINNFFGPILDWVLAKLTAWSVFQSFILNTALRKASEAADYTDSVNYKNSLPPTTSEDDYAHAEAAEAHAFYTFVVLSN